MRNRGQLALGVILILLGGLFIAQQQIPALRDMISIYMTSPLIFVTIGLGIFLFGLVVGAPGMSVPAAIVATVGGILYYQRLHEDYSSWSYMWTLIIASIGVGETVTGLLKRNWHEARSGLNTVAVSAVLFVIFASFLGGLNLLGGYGAAILLVLAGVWLLARGLMRKS